MLSTSRLTSQYLGLRGTNLVRTLATKSKPENVTVNIRIPNKLKTVYNQYKSGYKWMTESFLGECETIVMPDFYKRYTHIIMGLGVVYGGYYGGSGYIEMSRSYSYYRESEYTVNLGKLSLSTAFGASVGCVSGYVIGMLWPITSPFVFIVVPLSYVNIKMNSKDK